MQRATQLALVVVLAFLWACGAREPGVQQVTVGPALSRIAFGSCAFQWARQPIFRAVVASEPDLYLSLGEEWRKLAASPDWQHLVANVPVMATWDNHDYGHHSAGAEFPLKAQSQRIFLDLDGAPVLEHRVTASELEPRREPR